jgi:hypothetical protein
MVLLFTRLLLGYRSSSDLALMLKLSLMKSTYLIYFSTLLP